ncbi:hypothetical protein B0H15DRAFT_955866 [Mycena belliarum]|uniref:Uncharacterized protein n=1 Tax=Mycena belliarum TaxID=1033014 RepID=A0AAD6TSJ4_9AGAR|nr:hypothetical protein B0H15DRAFT_955866 [Mycena belliae]
MEWQQSLAGVFAQKFACVVDGHIVPTSACLKPVGLPQCVAFYAMLRQAVFAFGPQVHALCWAGGVQVVPADTAVLKSFLDPWRAATLGALYFLRVRVCSPSSLKADCNLTLTPTLRSSVLFLRTTPELVAALIDTLLALEVPFPFAFELGGRLAALPAEVI